MICLNNIIVSLIVVLNFHERLGDATAVCRKLQRRTELNSYFKLWLPL